MSFAADALPAREFKMAINLVSLVSQALTPQSIAQIGFAVGANPSVTQELIGGAMPSVIAALSGAADQTGGEQKISDLFNNADSAVLSKLTGAQLPASRASCPRARAPSAAPWAGPAFRASQEPLVSFREPRRRRPNPPSVP